MPQPFTRVARRCAAVGGITRWQARPPSPPARPLGPGGPRENGAVSIPAARRACATRRPEPVRLAVHRCRPAHHRAEDGGVADHRVGRPAVRRRRVGRQPRRGGRGPGRPHGRDQARGQEPPLRAQQGGVLLGRGRGDDDLRRRRRDPGQLDRAVPEPAAAGERRGRAGRLGGRLGRQRAGGPGPPAGGLAVPVDHADRRRQAPDDGRVDLGGRRRRGPARVR